MPKPDPYQQISRRLPFQTEFEPFYQAQAGVLHSTSSPRSPRGHFTQFNSCYHIRLKQPADLVVFGDVEYKNWCHGHVIYLGDAIYLDALSQAYLSLDFQENNTFELFTALADLDGTIAMFSRKFIKSMNYGALNWGVLPFISDLKSLANSITDAIDGIKKAYENLVGKRITRRCAFSGQLEVPVMEYKATYSGTFTFSGYLVGDLGIPDAPHELFQVFLDELGVHPDLKTVWDVIPLSFVVDYFIPVGDFLESLKPRGWFRPTFRVEGGSSVKAELRQMPFGGTGGSASWSVYVRQPGVVEVPSRPPNDVGLETPSPREIFNTYYLGAARRRK